MSKSLKIAGLLAVVGLVCGMPGISEAKRPNPAIDNTVILCSGYIIDVTADPNKLLADGESTSSIVATVTTCAGNPVANHKVKFSISPDEMGSFKNAAPDGTVTDTTDCQGKAESTYIAGTSPGTATITATDISVCPNISDTATITLFKVEIDIADTSVEDDDYIPVGGTQTAKARLLGPTGLTKTVDFLVDPSFKATVSPTSVSMTVGTDVELTITGVAASVSVNETKVIAKIGADTYGEEDCTVFGVEIEGEKAIRLRKYGVPLLRLTAVATPEEIKGLYTWSIIKGADKGKLIRGEEEGDELSPSTENTVDFRGTSKSETIDDITVQVLFIPEEADKAARAEHKLTVYTAFRIVIEPPRDSCQYCRRENTETITLSVKTDPDGVDISPIFFADREQIQGNTIKLTDLPCKKITLTAQLHKMDKPGFPRVFENCEVIIADIYRVESVGRVWKGLKEAFPAPVYTNSVGVYITYKAGPKGEFLAGGVRFASATRYDGDQLIRGETVIGGLGAAHIKLENIYIPRITPEILFPKGKAKVFGYLIENAVVKMRVVTFTDGPVICDEGAFDVVERPDPEKDLK